MAFALHARPNEIDTVLARLADAAPAAVEGWRSWPVGIVSTDANGAVLALNAAARSLLVRLGASEPLDDLFDALAASAPDLRAAAQRDAAPGLPVERRLSRPGVEATLVLSPEPDGRFSALLMERATDPLRARAVAFEDVLATTVAELAPGAVVRRLDQAGREVLGGSDRRRESDDPEPRRLADLLASAGVVADAARFLEDARRCGCARLEARRSGGGRRRVAFTLHRLPPAEAGAEEFLLVERDVTAGRVREAELRRLAETDPLTGVLNRRAFFAMARRTLELRGAGLSLVALDLDGFKRLNDRFGHAAGDAALQRVVEVVRANLRAGDLFGRLGGDEFAIVLIGAGPARAVAIADRLRLALAEAGRADGTGVTASFGVAVPSAGESFEEALARADLALYHAKAMGRDAVRLDLATEDEPRPAARAAAG